MLAQIAEEDGLIKSEKFEQIITSAKKELAASFAIEKYLVQKPINLDESKLKSFYSKNKEDYILANDAYVINYAEFKDEQDAIKFRDYAIHSGWDESLKNNIKDLSLLRQEKHKVLQLAEIQSPRIIRVLKELFKNEISLVIKTELNNSAVVQYLDKLNQNNVPNFKYVKDDVARTYKIFMQQKLIRKFIDSLFTKKNIKIYKGY